MRLYITFSKKLTTFGGFFPILLQLTSAVKITKEKGGSGRRGSVARQNGVRFHELWEEKEIRTTSPKHGKNSKHTNIIKR